MRGERERGSARDRGSASVELVLLTPVLILFLMLAIYGGRYALARQSVQAAASDAARAASIARSPTVANANAKASAQSTLQSEGLNCVSSTITIDTSAFNNAAGVAGSIAATVSCSLDLSQLAVPGVPGVRLLTATAISPLDTYREH